MADTFVTLGYLAAAVLFILGLKWQQHPSTARQGNGLASAAMLLAVIVTLLVGRILSPLEMLGGLVVGGGIGVVLARRVEMTKMPELVAAFNGFGGLASALVAGAEVARYAAPEMSVTELSLLPPFDGLTAVVVALSVLIGCVTCTGSFVAFGKLNGSISGNPVSFPGLRALTVLLVLGVVGLAGYMAVAAADFPVVSEPVTWGVAALAAIALVLGILLVLPIGGADMPVVVALLNSYSGLAAAFTGFVLDNLVLVVSGTLVGAAGFILTMIMCEAMNRSLLNVLLGGFGGDGASGPAVEGAPDDRPVRSTSAQDVAILMNYADQVVVVPGYGMAVAQAQHQVRELADLLKAKGIEVKYAIHPVAGRMPGHMNVLLAEANVPYEDLYEMDDINGEFETTDVALVIGANDVVNPSARTDEGSPIYGMPVLNVDRAQHVVVLKRSMRPGYSGVENELFFLDNTRMLFGDAKASVSEMVSELKDL